MFTGSVKPGLESSTEVKMISLENIKPDKNSWEGRHIRGGWDHQSDWEKVNKISSKIEQQHTMCLISGPNVEKKSTVQWVCVLIVC